MSTHSRSASKVDTIDKINIFFFLKRVKQIDIDHYVGKQKIIIILFHHRRFTL